MSLHNGVDTTAIVSNGVYSENYGSTSPGAIANLVATFGLIEDAIRIAVSRQFFTAMARSLIKRSSIGSKK